ncbi:MAG: hypothetical protein AAGF99_03085 [Bacteroidota bacterium]
MQQTLFSLAAIFSFSILGYTMHRNAIETEQEAYMAEIEAQAFDHALFVANEIKQLAFDEADVGRTQMRSDGDTAGLTPPAALGRDADERTFRDVDDLDDLRQGAYKRNWRLGNGQVRLRTRFDVVYVDPMNFEREIGPEEGPTTAKMVTIIVTEEDPIPGASAPIEVTLKVPLTPSKLFLHH